MADFAPDVTKQNITELLYKASLINNTDVQESEALSALVIGIYEQRFLDAINVQTAVNNGFITPDTYILFEGASQRKVDTAARIIEIYL